MLKRVIIESPYAGDVERNTIYAKRALLDSLLQGEAPFVSHLLYTLVLDDKEPKERTIGFQCNFAWYEGAEACVVYTDYGISRGMKTGMRFASSRGLPLEERTIGENNEELEGME